ncbi:MAG: ethanolamine ammonia-lyase reactivating factor EutA, partial [Litorivicinaceae bacterium]
MLQLHEGHHHHPSVESRQQVADSIWAQEHITLVTVGIDIGSSTSHLIFAKVHLQRRTQSLSARYEVVSREILWQSPILFTPFLSDGTIDATALGQFIRTAYHEAGLHAEDVDSGAVILTGEAIKRTNAQAIDELFAAEASQEYGRPAEARLNLQVLRDLMRGTDGQPGLLELYERDIMPGLARADVAGLD